MNIHFYLEGDSEESICTFWKVPSNPFEIGKKYHLDVRMITPRALSNYNQEMQKIIQNKHEESKRLFRHKTIEIVSEYNQISFDNVDDPILSISYYCKIVD